MMVWGRFYPHLLPLLLAWRREYRGFGLKAKLWLRKLCTLNLSYSYGTPAGVIWFCVHRGFGVNWQRETFPQGDNHIPWLPEYRVRISPNAEVHEPLLFPQDTPDEEADKREEKK